MTTQQILNELKAAGKETTKSIWLKHGAKEPIYGVPIAYLKTVQKKIKENRQQIALELFASGIGDAMYLAGLMADGSKMTKKELETWASKADWPMISEYSVAWVASENEAGWELGLKWIDSSKANMATTGWSTLSCILSTWPDEKLDMGAIKTLIQRIQKEIAAAPNRVRYCMNDFVISAGSFIKALTKEAIEVGKKIGEVSVDMDGTYCKVPYAPRYIKKVADKGYIGKKRKTAKC
jgi:3-methyladenine DNA glycosylase AlkD